MKRFFLILPLAACAQPDTIANPLAGPARAINATVEAASPPEARRTRVSHHVNSHHDEILSEINAGGGTQLSIAMELAWIAAPPKRRA